MARRKQAPPARHPLPAQADCPVCEGAGVVTFGGKVLTCLGCTYVPVPEYRMKPGGLAEQVLAIARASKPPRSIKFWTKRAKADEASRAYWASVRKGGE